MRKNILFDTSSGSLNMGDYIICESVERELDYILKDNFLVKLATHTPVTHFYQNTKKNLIYKYIKEAKYKFLAGTNIIQFNMLRPWANLNINLFNASPYKNVILVGVGSNPNSKRINFYTKMLYKKILNKDIIHSVRDEKTKNVLNSLGFKAINTGCATIWMLNKEHCSKIPSKKAKNVIFTLTDYCKDEQLDQKLINILNKNYENVYFWVQGDNDYEYIMSFENINNIKIVGPSIKEYKNVLESEDVDYVGTRLHAGIYAMQHFKRSIIISLDNRTEDMRETYNLPIIKREYIDGELEGKINSEFETDIKINEKAIEEWRSQFNK